MPAVNPENCLNATRQWVERFVVAHNVCPFAGREVERDSIEYRVLDGNDLEGALLELIETCRHLDETPTVETALLVFSSGLNDFDDYLDVLALAEALLVEQDYEGVYQLASFHPDYVFDGSDENDPANFTNRSPWPIWHVLREEGLERALAHYSNPEQIPERNIQRMHELGSEQLVQQLAALREQS
ncbi:DUF1415 domain-containing protein [Halomonas huangheensis]|uniref:DUF1415 domain-containing protein n=1 Tax=Halomonas huangheensis TaxID=1178482 RepID=W1N7A1_9GAMM|nr:DUF1415 domain-containing protein [Halomonas huangheensis]ALM53225.1 hypothetical protein AR456_13755 [Halomonas huangheensis]ERL51408.1 hypothetical protein BJB45_13395 [Halomonas huangheensis]